MSDVKPSSRARKLVIRSAVVGFFVIAAWVVVLVIWRSARTEEHGFRAETRVILKLLQDGHARQVYDQASPLLRADVTREYFVELADTLVQTLGPFKKIISTVPGGTVLTARGKTSSAKSRLRFKNASTTGKFNYHYLDNKWVLLGLDIEIPDKLQAASQASKPQVDLSEQLRNLTVSLFERIRDGEIQDVYDGSSDPFRKAIDKQRFDTIVALHKKRLGKLEKISNLSLLYQDKWKTYAEIEATLKYKRIKNATKATVEFIRIDNKWKLLAYRVSMSKR